MRRVAWVTVVAVAVAVGPAQAATFRGRTTQGRQVRITTAQDGSPRRASIDWKAGCRSFGGTFGTTTTAEDPFDSETASRFAERGSYTVDANPALHQTATVTAAFAGHRVSAYRWAGSFRASAVVRQNGRVVDRCHLAPQRWVATLPRATLQITSDNGDFIAQGQAYAYSTPGDGVYVSGGARYVHIGMGPFAIDVQPPSGQELRPGVAFDTTRYPFNGAGGGLDVDAFSRGCNTSTGHVVVEAAAYDSHRRVRALTLSFEQHCEEGSSALRGRFTFRR